MSDSNEPGGWHPLFVGEPATEVYRAVETIARLLRPEGAESNLTPRTPLDWSTRAVLYAYLDRAQPRQGHLTSAAAALEGAIVALNEVECGPCLYGGSTGVGWAVEHLRSQVDNVDSQTNDSIDEEVLCWLGTDPFFAPYDLISGLVGAGVYALERLPEPGGAACLAGVIDRLAKSAEEQPDGLAWYTRPERLFGPTRKAWPQGCYDVGMAHGVAGVIALLGEAHAAGIAGARPLLDRAVQWLLKRRQPEVAGSVFPPSLGPALDRPSRPGRLAWCYGDPGVAVALLGAARRLGEPSWAAAALDAARLAAQIPPEQSGVVDAGLCHGAAGLGHLYNRLYHATGEPVFAETARAFLLRALAMRKGDQGLAGYLSYGPAKDLKDGELQVGWFPDASFLTGVTGIALALLGAVSAVAPDWDRLLLTRL